jgi:undecaprenyl-diphosphatase
MSVVPELYVAGILAAFVSGFLAIKFLIYYLGKHGLGVFAIYRIAVGLLILAVGIKA